MAKKRVVATPLKRSPRFIGANGALSFDNVKTAVVHSDEEKASYFLSQYNEIVDPFKRFPRYWSGSSIDFDITLKKVKDGYKHYVLGKLAWSEDKYVAVVNELFERELSFSQFTFDWLSRLYEREELDSQQGERTQRRRRNMDRRVRNM